MNKRKKTETKKCRLCNRTIEDPKNKTGLCPSCEKDTKGVGAIGISVVLATIIKKYGSKMPKAIAKAPKTILNIFKLFR